MFLTKMSLPRRTFLQGVGAAVALPLLDAMIPAATLLAQTAARPVRRFGAVYSPNGMIMSQWTPESAAAGFDLPSTLKPFEPFRSHLNVVTNLSSGPQRGGGHALAEPCFMTGVMHPKRTEGADIEAGTTIDQVLAVEYSKGLRFPSVEVCAEDFTTAIGSCEIGFSCAYLNTISWRTPTTPLPMEIDPRLVFERMFSDATGTAGERAVRLRNRKSVLDGVTEQATRLQAGLAPADRNRLGDYLQNVREIEQRLERAERENASALNRESPAGVPDDYAEHVGLMFDLMVMAFQADVTRVFTFMMGRELSGRIYPNLGITEPHHAVSHHQNKPERIQKYATTNAYHAQLIARHLERLKATPDGNGTLLDNSLMLWGSGMSNPNLHTFDPLPVVLLGGDSGHLKGDRHLVQAQGTPMANLMLALANSGGASMEKFGDSTGSVSL
ncbi:MAG: DUF1552 domain-containing protein [Vicinamibacterales bacterium]